MHLLLQIVGWLIALAWASRTLAALLGIPTIPDLLQPQFDVVPAADAPRITVIVPARDEERDIAATLRSLLAQDYPNLTIVAVDDRSTDATGTIMYELAAAHPGRLQALTIEQLPPGWAGKTSAMATAAKHAIAELAPDYLLFTDADVFYRSDAIRRTMVNVVSMQADHFVVFPTLIIRRWGEAALISFFQVIGLWASRPWRVSDPRSTRDAVGIGAFNLLRVSAYRTLGGFDALRMEIVEDLTLARRVKEAGLAQRVAFGRDLVRVHWATGVLGIVNGLTKNLFAVFRYNVGLLLLGCLGFIAAAIAPFVAVFIHGYTLPAAIAIVSFVGAYFIMSPRTGIPGWNGLLAPFAATAFLYAMLRSGFMTLRHGGVEWRGSFYPLAELRRNLPPLFPRRK